MIADALLRAVGAYRTELLREYYGALAGIPAKTLRRHVARAKRRHRCWACGEALPSRLIDFGFVLHRPCETPGCPGKRTTP